MIKSKEKKNEEQQKMFNRKMALLVYEIRSNLLHESQFRFSERCRLSQKTISRLENADESESFSLDSIFRVTNGVEILPSEFFFVIESKIRKDNPELLKTNERSSPFYEAYPSWGSGERIQEMMSLLRLLDAIREILDKITLSGLHGHEMDILKSIITESNDF